MTFPQIDLPSHPCRISCWIQRRKLPKPLCYFSLHAEQNTSRGVTDVAHKLVAVGSRSVAKAQDFISSEAGGDETIKAYGSYDQVFADKVNPYYSAQGPYQLNGPRTLMRCTLAPLTHTTMRTRWLRSRRASMSLLRNLLPAMLQSFVPFSKLQRRIMFSSWKPCGRDSCPLV